MEVQGLVRENPQQGVGEELTSFLAQLAARMEALETRVVNDLQALNARIDRSRQREEVLHGNVEGLRQAVQQPALNAMVSLPTSVKLPRLEMVDGRNERKLRRFFQRVEGYLAAYQLSTSDHRSIFFTAQHFEGSLEDWWENRQRNSGDNIKAGFESFQELREAVFAEFRGRDPAEDARDKLASARQRSQGVKEFANYIRQQLLYLPERADQDNLHTFKRGLRAEIAAAMASGSKPGSFAEAVEKALEIEAALNARTKREGRGAALHALHSSRFEDPSDDDDTLYYSEDQSDEEVGTCKLHMVSGGRKKNERRTAQGHNHDGKIRRLREQGKCYTCGMKGHIAKYCPKTRKNEKEEEADSGSGED